MCGIAGVLDPAKSTPAEELVCLAETMASALEHRGPDDSGVWVDAAAGVALGHRRLSVVGLGPAGHQPMTSGGGRFVVNYNGEIYNHQALRQRLGSADARVAGGSDTAVLAAAIERWGLDGALEACEGMFALAVWDRECRELHLVRDRLGEKPLYYGWLGPTFAFASELKALRRLPGASWELDRDALALFLRHNCIPAPRTVYRGVAKLEPGQVVTVGPADRPRTPPRRRRYWSARAAVDAARSRPLVGTPEELADAVEDALGEAVAARMLADVPVGAFLSGGIDSSLVVALMQRQRRTPVRTFTIGLAHRDFDESDEATAVASHLGTDHTVLPVTEADALAVVPTLAEIWDEPFADSSQIPTLLVSRLARSEVTVALSGDGGDELFGGYNRHAWLDRLARRSAPLPPTARRWMGRALTGVPPGAVEAGARWGRLLGRRFEVRNPVDKVTKLGRVLGADGPEDAYLALVSHWDGAEKVVRGAGPAAPAGWSSTPWPALGEVTEQVMWLDLVGYLPDDVLTKLDRAAMAVSLETRVPFLDRQVLDVAWRLPLASKVDGGVTKRVLRRVLHRYVPAELVERPKTGFGIPVGAWLRGPLRPWAEELVSARRLAREGLLDPGPVRRAWDLHTSGRRDLGYALWDVLMLQAWLDRWMTAT